MSSEHYDIEAAAADPSKVTEAQLYVMLQTLLEDRFQLKTHRETKEVRGFALTVSKGGAKLQRATGKEDGQGIMTIVGKPLSAHNATMTALARFLGERLNLPVTDETGLSGGYNFTLQWTPGDNEVSPFANLPGGAQIPPEVRAKMDAAINGIDPNGPSLFTALQEQLGLRLISKPAPVQVLVIDSAERPSEN